MSARDSSVYIPAENGIGSTARANRVCGVEAAPYSRACRAICPISHDHDLSAHEAAPPSPYRATAQLPINCCAGFRVSARNYIVSIPTSVKWHLSNVHPVTVSQQGPKIVQPPPQTTPKGHACLFPNDAFPWLIGGVACIGSNRKAVAILLNIITGRRIRFMIPLSRCF